MTDRPRQFDLIAFDWDGTLFDSTALIVRAIQQACRDIGVAVPDDERASYVIGLGLRDALMHAVPGLPEARYPELGQRYRHHYFAAQHEISLFAGTLEMLHALRQRHHWLAVATGKTRQGLNEALAHTELKGLFDGSRTADETLSKPHPRMLEELMAEFGVPPERTLMIGDTTHDLQMAAHAGTASVGVSFGAHDHAAFEPLAPRFVAHSTRELHEWLLNNA
ncbi:MAG: HAD-IA family hydrolase [Burkholderiales bacterium]|nr:HAD-IA family hydrolase [Burkholderiales bacterium]